MPIPKPRKGEKQKDFVSRCHEAIADEFDDSKQRHAVCMQAWRDRNKKANVGASRMISVFNVAQEIEQRLEDLDGREHIVLPMVALVEGVYQCANCPGPQLYPAAEFGKNPGSWNGRPITIGHPQRSGAFVSAGSPDVWQTERIGTVFNARVEDTKLRVEAWIDPEAVERAGADAGAVMEAIEAGDQVEVSTASWIDEMPRFGALRGRKYETIQINFQPDHIAILKIGDLGACSWEDGCGIRVATAGEACCDACAAGDACACGHHAPATAQDEDDQGDPVAAQTARSLENALLIAIELEYGVWCYVADWDERFVYFVVDSRRGLRRRGYAEDDDGSVTLADDDDERVRPRTDFILVTNEATGEDDHQQEDGNMADKEKAAQVPSDDQSNKTPAEAKRPDTKAPPAASPPAPTSELGSVLQRLAALEAENDMLKEKIADKPATLEQWLEQAPDPTMREALYQAQKDQERRRLELVGQIGKIDGCLYSEDELKAKPVADLEKLLSLTKRPTDFSIVPAEQSRLQHMAEEDYAAIPDSPWDRKAS